MSALPPMCSDCGYEFVARASTEEPCPRCGGRRTTLRIDVSEHAPVALADVGVVTVWISSSFARLWYEDALQEARTENGFNARRKEIVFAVCFVESYLFEWVRDEALKHDFKRIRDYFTIRRGILDRWKDVVKQLAMDALIPATPAFGLPYWEDFQTLVSYRDGLVHAAASRPESDGVPDEERPVPPRQSLDTMSAGWPVRVAREVVQRLHTAAGTPPPDWLVRAVSLQRTGAARPVPSLMTEAGTQSAHRQGIAMSPSTSLRRESGRNPSMSSNVPVRPK